MTTKWFTVKIPVNLNLPLKSLAEKNRRSVNGMVRVVIEEHLRRAGIPIPGYGDDEQPNGPRFKVVDRLGREVSAGSVDDDATSI